MGPIVVHSAILTNSVVCVCVCVCVCGATKEPIPGGLSFSGCSGWRGSGSGPALPGCRRCGVWSILVWLCASSSATKKAEEERGREKKRGGIGKAGEEINGSVQEEWWRGIEKAVNSPFCSTRGWQEFHSLLLSLPTHVHWAETSHIWLPGWGVNFL